MHQKDTALKICLVRPPAALNIHAINRYSIPPIGLAYIAASIRSSGYEVQVVDGIGEAIQQYSTAPDNSQALIYGLKFNEILKKIHPDTNVIGITVMFSREWLLCKSLIEAIREAFPKALLVTGGEHITACAEYSLNDCKAIDVAVLGEGEETIIDLLGAIQQKRPFHEVPGLFFRQNDKIIKTAPRKRIKNLDSIPQPAWDLFPLEEYIRYAFSIGFDLGRSAPLLASRGCPFQCTFCSNPTMWNTQWFARTPSLVLAEMKEYIEKYKVSNFDFYDLTAIVDKKWIIEFCKLIIADNLQITWQLPSGTRSEALDEETLDWLYRAGCRSVIYAPESGSPEELKRIKKKVIIKRMLSSMKVSYKKGIRTKANIIFGMPGSNWKDVLITYSFLVRMAWAGVNDVGCFSFSPYPGSEMFYQLLQEGKISLDDEYFRSLNKSSNFTRAESFNDNFSGWQLTLINICGMMIFYGFSMIFRPKRLAGFLDTFFKKEISSSLARSISNYKNRKMASQLLATADADTVQLPIAPKY